MFTVGSDGNSWVRVFAKQDTTLAAPCTAPAGSFDYPTALRGSTPHFNVYYDPSLGAVGSQIADGVLGACETDYAAISGYFGGLALATRPLNVIIAAGIGGAYHCGCGAVDLYCDADTSPNPDVKLTQMLVVAEEVEVFSEVQGRGWDCGASNGEGLSRVLATELYPNELNGFTTAAQWLDSDSRPDYVTTNDLTDTNPISIACSVLFLNYLHHQLGYSWEQIVPAGGATLGQTYTGLTGKAGSTGFADFSALLAAAYPPGTPSGVTTDNVFPLPG